MWRHIYWRNIITGGRGTRRRRRTDIGTRNILLHKWELIVILRELIVIPMDLIVIPTSNLYLPSPHLIIVWDDVMCLNFCVILPLLMRGCNKKNKSSPTMNFPLTSIRENALSNLKTPTDIIHCWGVNSRKMSALRTEPGINTRRNITAVKPV